MDLLLQIINPFNLAMMNIGIAAGIIIGALPGLSVVLAITVLLPFTFGMGAVPAMYLLLGAYCGGIYGGSITAILINAPGTPNAAATVFDGHPLAQQGRAGDALKAALVASTFGGIISCIALIFFAPAIASAATLFGAPEYFALCVFGISIVVVICGGSILKSLMLAGLGLLVSTIGVDSISGNARFMFGNPMLLGGVQTVALMLGVFAISEILVKCYQGQESVSGNVQFKKASIKVKHILKYWKTLLKSSLIGVFIGAVPGTGGALAAFLSYNVAKTNSKEKELFGKGSIEGVVAPEAGNNAVTGATLIPMLTLGIPGDTAVAVLFGALTMQGITPGPDLFAEGNKAFVYCIMGGLLIINVFMLIQGNFFVHAFANVTKVPFSILVPCIMIFCILGSFAIRNYTFDIFVMLAFGIIGYFLKRCDFSIAPLPIALVLGQLTENNLRRALTIGDGSLKIFLHRPIAMAFLLISACIILYPAFKRILKYKGDKKNA